MTETASGRSSDPPRADDSGPRLDAFALPAATNTRFLLLIVSGVISSIYGYAWVAGLFGSGFDGPVAVARVRCVNDARARFDQLGPADLTSAFHDCVQDAYSAAVMVVVVLVGVLIAVAIGIYLLIAPRAARARLHSPSDIAKTPAAERVLALVGQMVTESGSGRVQVRVATLRGRAGARAYGRWPRYRVLLDVGLLARGIRRPEILRGVLAHELAHLRNRDVDIIFLAHAAWWAFVVVAVAPVIVVVLDDPPVLAGLSWRFGLLLTVVWLTRLAVHRTREYYADLRAAERPVDAVALMAALSASDGTTGGGEAGQTTGTRHRGSQWWWRIRAAASHHPTGADRLAVLAGAPRLFDVSTGEAAAAGFLVGFAYPQLSYLLSLTWPYSVFVRDWVVGLLLGVLAASAVAGSVWRAVYRSQIAGLAPPATSPIALALTGGVLGGQLVAPDVPNVGTWGMIIRTGPLVSVVVACLLLALCQTYLRWVVHCAAAWLPAVSRPFWAARFGTVQSAAAFGLWVSVWFVVVATLYGSYPTWQTLTVALSAAALNPVLSFSLAWACAYPLVAWIRRRQSRPRTIYLLAAAVVSGYAVALVSLYPRIRAALHQPPAGTGSVSVIWLLALIAVALIAVAGLVLGLFHGGRGRTARVAAQAGSIALLATAGIAPLAGVFLAAAACRRQQAWDCLPDWPPLGAQSFGVLLMAGFVVLVAAGALAAALGSLIRTAVITVAALRHGPAPGTTVFVSIPSTASPTTWRRTAAALAPVVVATGLLGWYGLASFRDSIDGQLSLRPDEAGFLTEQMSSVVPGQITRSVACGYVENLSVGVGVGAVGDDEWLRRLVGAAIAAASSDDPVLRMMGQEAGQALVAGDLRRNDRANSAAGHYCAIVRRATTL